MANIMVKHDIIGIGHDTENAAIYSTRFRFSAEYCGGLDLHAPRDPYLQLLLEIPGVTRADVYKHAGLYDVYVKKAGVYSWEEVDAAVLKILEYRHEQLTIDGGR